RTVHRAGHDDRGDLVGRRGPHDGQCAAVPALAPIDFPRRQVAADEHMSLADRGAQRVEQPVHVDASLALCSRERTWAAQAANSATLRTTSAIASGTLGPRSLVARTTPS